MLKRDARVSRRHHHATRMREDAAADLRLIREAMDHSSRFTDVPGVGTMLIGGTALIAAWLAAAAESDAVWMSIWGFELLLAVTIGLLAVALKARRSLASRRARSARLVASSSHGHSPTSLGRSRART